MAQATLSSILAEARVAVQKYPLAEAVYLQEEATVTIEADGSYRDTTHCTVLILTKAGADDYGVPVFSYTPNLQTASLDYARTITVNGTVTVVTPDSSDVYNGLYPTDSPMIPKSKTDDHAYGIFMPQVGPRTVIDYQVTVYGKYPYMPGQFSNTWELYQRVPVEKFEIKVIVSTLTSWDHVAPTVAAGDWVKQATRNQTFNSKTDMQKIESIFEYVQQHICNNDDVPHNWPRPAAVTFAYKKGDCKDQAVLLMTMLKTAGIDSYPVLIDTDLGGDTNFSLPPTFDAFDHMIVAIPQGTGWLFLDSTVKTCAFGCLPIEDSGKHAVLITGDTVKPWRLVETPQHTPNDNYISVNAEFTLTQAGVLSVQVEAKVAGSVASYMRNLVGSNSDLESIWVRALIYGMPYGMQFTSFSSSFSPSDVFPPRDPITDKIKFTALGLIQTNEKERYFLVMYVPPLLAPRSFLNDIPNRSRVYPYFAYPKKSEELVHIGLPAAMPVSLPP